MWEYETRVGTFWICLDQPGVCELWFEDKQLGHYSGIEEATEAVDFYLEQEEAMESSGDLFRLRSNWETYDEVDAAEEEFGGFEGGKTLETWHYPTSAGTFCITRSTEQGYDLLLDGTAIGLFRKPDEAARAVAQCKTGVEQWDDRDPIEKPSGLSEWTAGPPL